MLASDSPLNWKSKYRKIKKIGEGAHGVVFKALLLDGTNLSVERSEKDEKEAKGQVLSPLNNNPRKRRRAEGSIEEEQKKEYCAIKKIRVKSSREGISLDAIREIKLLQELHHPNIMRVLDIFNHNGNVNLVLEYMVGDLENIIHSQDIILKPADIKQYMIMILESVDHCHKNWILHRDLKPGNCLIAPDGRLKLGDFGLAKIYGSPNRQLSHQACTIWYRAPELLYGSRHYGTGADIWSVGCILAELLLRQPFFPGKGEIDQLSKIFARLGTPDETQWPGMKELPAFHQFEPFQAPSFEEIFPASTPETLNLLRSLLTYNPASRPTAAEALTHPYFTEYPSPTPISQLPQLRTSQDDDEDGDNSSDNNNNNNNRNRHYREAKDRKDSKDVYGYK